jgi:general secretion pathway protein G
VNAAARPALVRNLRAANSGYTLIEIMLVLSIIVVLMGLGVNLLIGNLNAAKETRVRADFQALKTALSSYEMDNFRMPNTSQGLKALVEKPGNPPVPKKWRPYLEHEMLDPWGAPYNYRNPGRWNPKSFDVWSLGADGVEGNDDITNNPNQSEKEQ